MIVEAVQTTAGMGQLRIIGRLGYTLHETAPIPWDIREPQTKAEIVFAVAKTGITHPELYDVVRQEQNRQRRKLSVS